MALLCKNLRSGAANCINHHLGAWRPLSASAFSSIRPCLDDKPNTTGRFMHRDFHNIAMSASTETRETSPAHYLVQIDSFSMLDKCGRKYETGEFKVGDYKWKLIIYPNWLGSGKESGECVSASLSIADTNALPPNWEVNAVFSVCVFNHLFGHYQYVVGKNCRFHAMKKEWGLPIMLRKDHMDPLNGYRINDSCVFGAEVLVNENKPVIEYGTMKKTLDAPLVYKRDLQILNFSKQKDDLYTKEFTAEGHKWKIRVCPNGTGDATGRSLSIFLQHVDSKNESVKACFSIRIKDQTSFKTLHQQSSYAGNWFSASQRSFGWADFIDLASLKDPSKGFIVKDCCVLEIEIAVQATIA